MILNENLQYTVMGKFSYGWPDIQELRKLILKQCELKGEVNIGLLSNINEKGKKKEELEFKEQRRRYGYRREYYSRGRKPEQIWNKKAQQQEMNSQLGVNRYNNADLSYVNTKSRKS
ncbi:hypothetical protein H5410_050105 [Solanum commersonii]|uniref:DUF4283 domain-containing protein n=1 Tax=Solanum commersonii TaxID=4109 RepID=A0A9J5WX07_SOLCO|nr:hypothetical protein H5410_050105 [Solanum commersonii]